MTPRDLLPVLAVLAAALLLLGLLRQELRARQAVARRLQRHAPPPGSGAAAPAEDAAAAEGWAGVLLFRARLPARGVAIGAPALLLAVGAGAALLVDALAGILAPVAAALLLGLLLQWRILRLRERLRAALPTFLDGLRQQLLVGASVPQALGRAVAAAPPEIRWVLQPAERRVQAGGELVETLEWIARRHGGSELAALAAAVSASMRFGGRLTEALANLAAMERQRLQMHREMRSATAEVRVSSVILAALPLLVAGYLAVSSPGFVAYFLDPERGLGVLYVVAALYLTGLLLLRQIAQPRF